MVYSKSLIRGALYFLVCLCVKGSTTEWVSLGGFVSGEPAVAMNSDGRLEVFARGSDNSVWHRAQVSPGSASWSSWASLNQQTISDPAVGINTDGTMQVFVIGTDHAIWQARQTSAGSANWSGWSSLGGQGVDDPAVGTNADGRLEVFIHTASGSLWHVWENSPSGSWAAGDEIVGEVDRPPTVGRNSDGRLMVFVGDTDGKFWWIIQNSAGADSWSPWWCLLGGTASAPVVGTNADSRLQLFAVQPDGSFWTSSQTTPGSYSWTDWSSLGNGVSGNPSVVRNADGRLEAFARRTDNSLYHMWQTSPGGAWTGWASLGGALSGAPMAVVDSSGTVEAFAGGSDSGLWYIGASSGGAGLTPQSGWWWDPNLSGTGFFIEYGGQSGSGVFMGGFFSDVSGNPTWLVSTGAMSGSTYSGTWLHASGGQPLGGTYRSPNLATSGPVSMTFTDSAHGVLTRSDGSTINLQRYSFSGLSAPEAGTPQIGWWWGGAALSGSGYAIEFQGSSVFIAAYVYDGNGNPVWYLATGELASPTTYTGTWDMYTGGPQLNSPEGTYGSHKAGSAGAVTITFSDATHGTIVMGNVSIPITRYQSF